jgi:hypothetical protein
MLTYGHSGFTASVQDLVPWWLQAYDATSDIAVVLDMGAYRGGKATVSHSWARGKTAVVEWAIKQVDGGDWRWLGENVGLGVEGPVQGQWIKGPPNLSIVGSERDKV